MIVTATPNPSIDVSTAVDRVEPDRKLRCDQPVREPGGGGLKVARAIARGRILFWAALGIVALLFGLGLLRRTPLFELTMTMRPPGPRTED